MTTKLIAHRGASSEAPENTLAAMRKAIELGVDYIEFDVRLSRDGVPVVIHDPTVFRTTSSGTANCVNDLTFDLIKELDAGSWFNPRFANEKIPSLHEVLQLEKGKTGVMIEIKEGKQSPALIVQAILKVLEETRFDIDFLTVGSFSVPIVQELNKCARHLRIMGIVEEVNRIEEFMKEEVSLMAVWHKILDPIIIHTLHENSIEVWTFTVDDPKIATFLKSIGIDGIITNHPRLILELCF